MLELQFEWDPAKAEENLRNHGVSFEEAQTVFYDDFATEFYNDKYSLPEPYQPFERYKGLIAYSPFI